METIKQVLMRRDGLTAMEADDLIAELQQAVWEGEDPEEVLYGIGLEPDYVMELL